MKRQSPRPQKNREHSKTKAIPAASRWRLAGMLGSLLVASSLLLLSNSIRKANASLHGKEAAVAAAAIVRAALDDAALRYQANPTDGNARLLNGARAQYLAKVKADPASFQTNSQAGPGPSAEVQLQALKEMKRNWTATQRKIGSRLLLASFKQQGRMPLVLESMRTNVQTAQPGTATVDILVTNRVAGLKKLDPFNLTILNSARRQIRAVVPLAKLEQIAAIPEVVSIREPIPYRSQRAMDPAGVNSGSGKEGSGFGVQPAFPERSARVRQKLATTLNGISFARAAMVGSVTSEGDVTHRAAEARGFYGVNGAGVKIGVLADGVDSLGSAQGTGDLGPVTVLSGQAGEGDGGTAMLEIIHDLAPGAQLFFATAGPTESQFAQNIRDLRTAGCDIIVDDMLYLDESPFHDGEQAGLNSVMGIIAQAVNDVTAGGALYFSSAGDQGNKDAGTSGTWEGNFTATAAPDPAPLAGANLNNFGDGGNSISVQSASGNPVMLFWSDPLDTASDDYDLYDMDGGLTTIFDASTDTQDGTGGDDQPFEFIGGGTFSGERLLIDKFAGSDRFLSLQVFEGVIDPGLSTDGSTHGHSAGAAAFSVAATPASGAEQGGFPAGPFPGPFTSANVSEPFTSDGPRQLFYQGDGALFGTGTLSGQGTTRQKPDITAADGVMTSISGFNPFFGTSAAAPHAAAIAALVKSSNLSLTPAQIRTALTSSAIDIQAVGTDRDTGVGIVMAFQALTAAGATPQAFLQAGAATLTAENCSPANGVLDPGETATVSFCAQNIGGANTTNAVGTLMASGGVTSPGPAQTYGLIHSSGAAVCKNFSFKVDPALLCGTPVIASIHFQDGSKDLGTLTYTLLTGTLGTPHTFSYTGPVVPIPDSPGADTPGTAADANLVVSGITGGIGHVALSIDGTSCSATAGSTTVGIDHTFVNDLVIRLRSPSGTVVDVISRTDGGGNNFCQVLLDDASAGPSIQSVSSSSAPFTGTYTPANPLSVFAGENPNGTWQLEAQDFFIGDTGNIRAFSIIITPAVCSTTCIVPPTFNTCIQDDATGDFIQINSTTGAYSFTHCKAPMVTLTGTGTVKTVNSVLTLTDSKPDRKITAQFNLGQRTGSATITDIFAGGLSTTYHLNMVQLNHTCVCSH
jgi:subtilisin-like proprotein convertase family protein